VLTSCQWVRQDEFMSTHGHLGVQELADLLGISRQRVYALQKTYDDFPAPAAQLRSGPVWHSSDVETWKRTRTVKTGGRPPTARPDTGEQQTQQAGSPRRE
jgi:predicted DNA-binding transcriptional regulator AlpA